MLVTFHTGAANILNPAAVRKNTNDGRKHFLLEGSIESRKNNNFSSSAQVRHVIKSSKKCASSTTTAWISVREPTSDNCVLSMILHCLGRSCIPECVLIVLSRVFLVDFMKTTFFPNVRACKCNE